MTNCPRLFIAVHRHIGGLEEALMSGKTQGEVHRHIGGLEERFA